MVTDFYSFARIDDSLNCSVGGAYDNGMFFSLPSCFVPSAGPAFTFSAGGESPFRLVEELQERISGLLITVTARISGAVPRVSRRAALLRRRFCRQVRQCAAGVLKKCRILRL